VSVTLCAVVRFTCFYLHKVPGGLPTYILRPGSGRTDGRDGRPRRIRCYKMCSIHSGLCCWDATTQAASDDAPSQRRGWRGVLSFFFEVGRRQGRVTLPCKSLRGVRVPNKLMEKCSRRLSQRHEMGGEKEIQGFKADSHPKACKKGVYGQGKRGLSEEEGWGKKCEERRVRGTRGGG